ncbi:nitrite reductase/ring-hydroxylating ferredoxin subunit [Thermocatellispora tengchongensis]|uniref:Nitrite reductase/ring-hydroxylating ferredoxin subunit n=1 Tax=Thermocatellispora tengchongensis TaxID=1073253 RepID=A0A840P7X4_9ACTN|nr:Rieske (2Fe-2S) protein [Thermocatellispora tengchongensis]MBB5133317.1 nitrite reductase/ring-hydroxylating ferredoxin subunit [Thermocatellispora tengchongensis]
MSLAAQAPGGGWVRTVPVADVPAGGALAVDLDEGGVLLIRTRRGRVLAYDIACPHLGARLDAARVGRWHLTCPVHAYRFRVSDGMCVRPRGRRPLRACEVRVLDGVIYVSASEKD